MNIENLEIQAERFYPMPLDPDTITWVQINWLREQWVNYKIANSKP